MSHDHSSSTIETAILTVSDTRKMQTDISGDRVESLLIEAGHRCQIRKIVPDQTQQIQAAIQTWMGNPDIDAIIVTGGTGVSMQDVTPDAILPMCTTLLPGFGELFRHLSFEVIGPAAMLSRAGAGILDCQDRKIPIFFLPGSPHAVELAVKQLIAPQLGHLVDLCHEKVKQ